MMELPIDDRIQGQWVPVTPIRKTCNLRDLIQNTQIGDELSQIPYMQLLGTDGPTRTNYFNAEPSNWMGDSGTQFWLTGLVRNVTNTRYNPSNVAEDLDSLLSYPVADLVFISNFATNLVRSNHVRNIDTHYTLNGYPLASNTRYENAESSSPAVAVRSYIDDVNRIFLPLGQSNVDRHNLLPIPQYNSHMSFIPNLTSLPKGTMTGMSAGEIMPSPQTPLPMEKKQRTMTQSHTPVEIIDLESEASCSPLQQHFSNQVEKSQITTNQLKRNERNVLSNTPPEIIDLECETSINLPGQLFPNQADISQITAQYESERNVVYQSDEQGKNQSINLNTPQQKPKRKKHRPKVVKEGIHAKAPKTTAQKPSNANVTTNGKRKYTQGAPANIAVDKAYENAESSNKGAKRSLKFVELPFQEAMHRYKAGKNGIDFNLHGSLDPQQNGFGRMVNAMTSSIGTRKNWNRLARMVTEKSTYSQGKNSDTLPQGSKREYSHVCKSQANANGYFLQSNNGDSSSCESCNGLHKRNRIEHFNNSKQNGNSKELTFADTQRMMALQNMQFYKSRMSNPMDMRRNGCVDRASNAMNCLMTSGSGRMNYGTHGLAADMISPMNTVNYGIQVRPRNTMNFDTISTPSRMNNGSLGQASDMIHCHNISSVNTINNSNQFQAPNIVNFNMISNPIKMNNVAQCQASNLIHCHNNSSTNTIYNGIQVRAQPPNAVMNCYQPSTPEKASHIHNSGDKCYESYGHKVHVEAQFASQVNYEPSGVFIKYKDHIDAFAGKIERLNINDSVHPKVENVLVPYTSGVGAMVPYTNPQDLLKNKKPRPKVDLDPESDRAWKILMGLKDDDGSNVNKEKWWEEERRVFHGRADSFIARMHLIQGNRKFSKWKGSVVDSIIGVFLTQNVSDHLSSSAFMSLAASFPPKSKADNSSTRSEITSTTIVSDDDCHSDASIKTATKELLNSNESNQSTSTNAVEVDDVFSSPNSTVSSQNSSYFPYRPIYQTGPTLLSNFEARELLTGNRGSRCTSFAELLQSADASVLHRPQVPFNNGADWYSFHENIFNYTGISNINSEFSGNLHAELVNSTISVDKLLVKNSEVSRVKNPLNGTSKNSPPSYKAPKVKAKSSESFDWDSLRKDVFKNHGKKGRSLDSIDSLDYEALRQAGVNEISKAIQERGMSNVLAERMKAFLDRLVKDHGSVDLEWLRDTPPEKAKDYLLSFRGLGLKSVECVRLLTLHHLAFPVDTNVARIAVRLGWVPLQPLPESLQLHLLEMYPMLETVQKYLWPRLCKLDQPTLYELHYQLITFGKVFCTKREPNCNSCPMRAECKHFASSYASARLALPAPDEKIRVSSDTHFSSDRTHTQILPYSQLESNPQIPMHMPMFQLVSSIDPQIQIIPRNHEPIIEEPASPELEPEDLEALEKEIEDAFYEDSDEIPTIKLNLEQFTQNLENYMQENNMMILDGDLSKALVAIDPQLASIPIPKLKNISRLRTEHTVYLLPDDHALLKGFDKREPDDPSPYLLAIWTPGETSQSVESPNACCNTPESGQMCGTSTCFSCNSFREAQTETVRGTILIPCRTANKGSFPLNGTYFQVNEVFADHESSCEPIHVPTKLIWELERRTVYFGSSVTSIFKDLTTEAIQQCFWKGFVCVRGFDRLMRSPKPLFARLHFNANKNKKSRQMAVVKL